jgi:predicted transcriptional regulator
MKAIIELSHKGSIFGAVKQQIADAAQGQPIDYHLGFESARALFPDLTPARLDLLDTLRRMGGSSVYALAKMADGLRPTEGHRNYSNVHTDVARLLELGLIERSEDGMVSVPFDAMTSGRS